MKHSTTQPLSSYTILFIILITCAHHLMPMNNADDAAQLADVELEDLSDAPSQPCVFNQLQAKKHKRIRPNSKQAITKNALNSSEKTRYFTPKNLFAPYDASAEINRKKHYSAEQDNEVETKKRYFIDNPASEELAGCSKNQDTPEPTPSFLDLSFSSGQFSCAVIYTAAQDATLYLKILTESSQPEHPHTPETIELLNKTFSPGGLNDTLMTFMQQLQEFSSILKNTVFTLQAISTPSEQAKYNTIVTTEEWITREVKKINEYINHESLSHLKSNFVIIVFQASVQEYIKSQKIYFEDIGNIMQPKTLKLSNSFNEK